MRLAYQSNTWGGVVGHPVGVTSIKDLFYLANGSTEQAVAEIAQAGYEGIELFDGNVVAYADAPESLCQLLDAHRLQLVGTYSGGNFIFDEILDQELWRVNRAAALAAELGARHLVVGGGAQTLVSPRQSDYDRLCAALERVVEIAGTHGLIASFHPHMSTIVETAEQIERVLAGTSIGLCPDTGHVLLAGDDPTTVIRTFGERIRYVHLKDTDEETGQFVPLGEGGLDLSSVMEALKAIGYDDWLAVELDAWPDPADGARRNRRALEPWVPTGSRARE